MELDEAEVETVDDGYEAQGPRQPYHNDESSESYLGMMFSGISWPNPWVLLGLSILLYFMVRRYYPDYERWRLHREEHSYHENIRRDPRAYKEKVEAMAAARQRQQEEYLIAAQVAMERQKELEEEKRANRLLQKDKVSASKISKESSKSSKKLVQCDYNPLAGGGGNSSGFRPSRRSANTGGG